jgi:hypothetical protein
VTFFLCHCGRVHDTAVQGYCVEVFQIVRDVSDPPPVTAEVIRRCADEGAKLSREFDERTKKMEELP